MLQWPHFVGLVQSTDAAANPGSPHAGSRRAALLVGGRRSVLARTGTPIAAVPRPKRHSSSASCGRRGDLVHDKFYGDIPSGSTPAYGAIRGALATLEDPYTVFVEPDPRAIEKADLEGQFGGIGAAVRRGETGEVFLQPMVNSPAARAGVLDGDQLLKVEDTPSRRR